MALVLRGKSECPLCELVIEQDDRIVMSSHFIADSTDPLWRFSDAAMHQKCFLDWAQRKLFVEKFNQVFSKLISGNGTYHHMNDDGTIVWLTRSNS